MRPSNLPAGPTHRSAAPTDGQITLTLAPGREDLRDFILSLPRLFAEEAGTAIHVGRNVLREFRTDGEDFVVKSYAIPNCVNQLAYGLLRASKAQRSYEYALLLRSKGIDSPEPVAWMTQRSGLRFLHSFYICRKSALPYTYRDLMYQRVPQPEAYLREVAHTTARLHEAGILHKDYSQGNILLGSGKDGQPRAELIDLNRLRFFRRISIEKGCSNLAERLPMTTEMRQILAETYAADRRFDPQKCLRLLEANACSW